MSVANASGFEPTEYMIVKKVSETGFSEEVVTIVSASVDNLTTGAGRLMVTRGTSGSAAAYEEGQVLVSTGKLNTGYIKLNASPADTSTPYIDIIERTGSAYADTDLKARLGDLSGLAVGLVGTDPGYGLYSQNVFLTGTINAPLGHIGGWQIGSAFISSSDNSVLLNSSTPNIALGTNSHLMNMTTGTGVYMDGAGNFRAGMPEGYRISFDGSNLILSSSDFFLGGDGQYISGSAGTLEMSSSKFHLDTTGNITGSSVYFTGGEIAGWTFNTGSFSKNGVRLEAETDGGLYISDDYNNDLIAVASKSMYMLGSATDEMVNDSFEYDVGGL
jgi:hypothetical protein